MKWKSYFRCAWLSTVNIFFYIFTLARHPWLEGRINGNTYRNWARNYPYTPVNFATPATEEEIIALIKASRHLRVVGAGHSFNTGVVSDHTLVSLDKYSGLISKNLSAKQMTFKAGTRIRDVIKILLADGLAFSALPSHDAQSLAGILSTDVHGTGREWGFVSEAVVELKIIDGRGEIIVCRPEDDLFKAAIGGIGAVGIITEVTIQAVDRFHVQQKFWITTLREVEDNLEDLIQANDHLSLYLFPFSDKCQVNTWNRTKMDKSFLGGFREFVSISADSLLAAWLGNLFAYLGLLSTFSRFAYGWKKGTDLVLESNSAFNRSIYYLHQELEFTIPYAQSIPVWRHFLQLYEALYPQGLPYAALEVRFTPAGHNRTLIGPGRERRSTWIDLIINDSAGFEIFYAAVEADLKQMAARPHLGKYCVAWDYNDLAQRHQDHFTRFLQLKEKHDPQGKFKNRFTRQLFNSDRE